MKNLQKTGHTVGLSDYLNDSPDNLVASQVESIRRAVRRARVDTSKVRVTDIHEKDIVATTRRGVMYLDRKTLRNSTNAELEHRLRHEQTHIDGIYSEGLVELLNARHNATGREFYKRDQARVKKVTDIFGSNGVEEVAKLYKQKKIKLLYRTFLMKAAHRKINRGRAHDMFVTAFPELEKHIKPKKGNESLIEAA